MACKLNHDALSWTPDGTSYVGPTNIRQEVTVAPGGAGCSGSFSIDRYDAAGVNVVGHVAGTTAATRVTVD